MKTLGTRILGSVLALAALSSLSGCVAEGGAVRTRTVYVEPGRTVYVEPGGMVIGDPIRPRDVHAY